MLSNLLLLEEAACARSPPIRGEPLANFEALVAKVHEVTSYNLRQTILQKMVLGPWNWARSLAELVAKEIEVHVTSRPLVATGCT